MKNIFVAKTYGKEIIGNSETIDGVIKLTNKFAGQEWRAKFINADGNTVLHYVYDQHCYLSVVIFEDKHYGC